MSQFYISDGILRIHTVPRIQVVTVTASITSFVEAHLPASSAASLSSSARPIRVCICGRYRLTRVDKLTGRFDIEPEDDWAPRYNIAPTQDIPVIRQHAEEPIRFGSKMRWGLIPSWAKDASIGHKMINARAETVAPICFFRVLYEINEGKRR